MLLYRCVHHARRCTLFLFFFQAEDGIRDVAVTGVQTCALPISEAQETVRQIEKLGRRATAVGADLGQVSEIKRVFDEAGRQFGRLDILVNSAANFLPASMVSTTEEIWDSSLDTNLRAPFFCAQAAAPWLRRTEGVIINFADTGGLRGWTGFIPHSISKAGVIMLTTVLAKA